MRLAFVDPDTGRASLALAIEGRDREGRYLIGPVSIAP